MGCDATQAGKAISRDIARLRVQSIDCAAHLGTDDELWQLRSETLRMGDMAMLADSIAEVGPSIRKRFVRAAPTPIKLVTYTPDAAF